MMKKIKLLSPDVISKIAAGEVIERPVYAVKELIENAIDAQADVITLYFEKGGLEKLVIIDNGEGMSKEDLAQSYLPHTTSKIKTIHDLDTISSFGFRGEALSSIASISNMTIKSKTKETATGYSVEIEAGVQKDMKPTGMPNGTNIAIENLFYTVPARQKFLKSQQTEFRYILDIITSYAIAHPEIEFEIIHNKKSILHLPKIDSVSDRIILLLGEKLFNQLLPIFYKDDYVNISGFISKPQLTTTSSGKSFFYINNRPIKNKLLMQTVKQSYGNLIELDKYPMVVLFLKIPVQLIDVNVHPRKEEVQFHNTDSLQNSIQQAIDETLKSFSLTYTSQVREKSTTTYAADILRKDITTNELIPMQSIQKNADIIQLHDLYLVVQTKKGFLLTDQHAAHERILYEQYLESFKKQQLASSSITLSPSITLELSLSDTEIVEENLKQFRQLGFSIDIIGEKIVIISKAPEIFKDRNIQKIVIEMIDSIREERVSEIDSVSKKMITYLACRSAVKAGDTLTKDQAKKLIEQLEKTPNKSTCPHGRPTQYEISLNELHRMFKRK